MDTVRTDVVVIGSGIAGLFLALKVSRFAEVIVLTKKMSAESNTFYAQGGIASVMGSTDSFDLHIADTMAAGQGLCKFDSVEIMVREGPGMVRELIELGVRFNREEGGEGFQLGREGGHSAPRILHYGDLTGQEVESSLLGAVNEAERVTLCSDHMAIDLIVDDRKRVHGCFVLDREGGKVKKYIARHTVIATGGAGKIYLYTSNPDIATGDGIAMAYRGGATITNLEFVQFHPTCLYHPDAKSLLISETLRGEGAVLKNLGGEEFMRQYDERAELAPRDIVARAIDREMKKSGDKHVLLDISHRRPSWLKSRFPFIYENCLKYGIDIGRQPIPVVPAAHYMCGGIRVDMNGHTDLDGLLAIGEAACTGVHGANRLASNSLLEALVVSHRCAAWLEQGGGVTGREGVYGLDEPFVGDPKTLETVILDHDWDLTRRVMWDYVGIVRSEERLGIARARIAQIQETVERLYHEYGVSGDMVELRNIALVSGLVVTSALSRKESRGLHYMIDYPNPDPAFERDTGLCLGDGSGY
ncbi:MAG: L-aspartate oxidase [bacterium]|nr:MAG: L-aspartate oxidase [bacterium]